MFKKFLIIFICLVPCVFDYPCYSMYPSRLSVSDNDNDNNTRGRQRQFPSANILEPLIFQSPYNRICSFFRSLFSMRFFRIFDFLFPRGLQITAPVAPSNPNIVDQEKECQRQETTHGNQEVKNLQKEEEEARQQREKEELGLRLLENQREKEKLKLETIKKQCEEEELRIQIQHLQKQQEEERIKKEKLEQERVKLSDTNAQASSSLSIPLSFAREEDKPYRMVLYNKASFFLPKSLQIIPQDENGMVIATLPSVCQLKVFPNKTEASSINHDVRELCKDSTARPQSTKELQKNMGWVYWDMKNNMKGQGTEEEQSLRAQSSRQMVKCLEGLIKEILEQIPEGTPIPLLMHRSANSPHLSRVLIEIQGGGVLLLVPDTFEEQRKEREKRQQIN